MDIAEGTSLWVHTYLRLGHTIVTAWTSLFWSSVPLPILLRPTLHALGECSRGRGKTEYFQTVVQGIHHTAFRLLDYVPSPEYLCKRIRVSFICDVQEMWCCRFRIWINSLYLQETSGCLPYPDVNTYFLNIGKSQTMVKVTYYVEGTPLPWVALVALE